MRNDNWKINPTDLSCCLLFAATKQKARFESGPRETQNSIRLLLTIYLERTKDIAKGSLISTRIVFRRDSDHVEQGAIPE